MKIRYEITTISLKEQIQLLTEKLEFALQDKEYNRCKGNLCETNMAYQKIMETRAKRKKKVPVVVE